MVSFGLVVTVCVYVETMLNRYVSTIHRKSGEKENNKITVSITAGLTLGDEKSKKPNGNVGTRLYFNRPSC